MRPSVHSVVTVIGDVLVNLEPADQRRALQSVFLALGLNDPTCELIGAAVRIVRRGNPEEVLARGSVRHVITDTGGNCSLVIASPLGSDGLSVRPGGIFQVSLWDESSEVLVDEPQRGEPHVG